MKDLSEIKHEKNWIAENEELRSRLAIAEETLDAIRNGRVDAIVVPGADGDQIYSISSAETPYRLIIEEMNEGAVTLTSDGIILYCNQTFAKLVNHPIETLTGSLFQKFISAEDHPKLGSLLRQGLNSQVWGEFTASGNCSNEAVYFQISFNPLPAELGDICIIITDISELKKREKDLREARELLEKRVEERTSELAQKISELNDANLKAINAMMEAVESGKKSETANRRLLEEISERKQTEKTLLEKTLELDNYFNSSLDLLCIANTNGEFIRLNPEWEKVLGYSVAELEGRVFLDFVHPEDIKSTLQAIALLVKQHEVSCFENRYLAKDGSYRWIEWRSKPQGNKIYATARDITQRKKNEQKIQLQNQELEKLNATKDKFFSIIAHDLKSPFNSILGFSEILSEEAHKHNINSVIKFAGVINSAAKHSYQLLENLLKWARMQQGRIPFEPQTLLLNRLVGSEINGLKISAENKNIQISNRLDEEIILFADENMLSSVVRNLISNAIKFTPKNGEITITAKQTDGQVIISVSDTGKGITTEEINNLFKIETSFSTQGTENEKGTGLGLLLCKDFIQKHKGNIAVKSMPGKGSTFTIYLPK